MYFLYVVEVQVVNSFMGESVSSTSCIILVAFDGELMIPNLYRDQVPCDRLELLILVESCGER